MVTKPKIVSWHLTRNSGMEPVQVLHRFLPLTPSTRRRINSMDSSARRRLSFHFRPGTTRVSDDFIRVLFASLHLGVPVGR